MKVIRIILLTLLLFPSGFVRAAEFSDGFATTPDRVWIGAAYWANPMEDWHIQGGRLECLSNGGNRNVHVLTHQLADRPGPFELSVRTGLLERRRNGSVGFRVGIADEIVDYRGNCFWGEGVNAVLSMDGQLVIGKQRKKLDPAIDPTIDLNDLTLRLTGEAEGDQYRLTLTATRPDGTMLGELSAQAEPNELVGNIALVNNHTPAGNASRFWFREWNIRGDKVQANQKQTFGPILWSMYTLNDSRSDEGHVLRMTAQMPPIGADDSKEVVLEVQRDGKWQEMSREGIEPEARTATFRIPHWPATEDAPYRLVYETQTTDGRMLRDEWSGTIRRDPADRPIAVAGMTCQMHYGFPYTPLAKNLAALDPDLLYFSGDQIYEQNGHYGIVREPADRAILNYLRKWYMFGWAFGDIMRDRPTVALPDDHDVFHGNLWGEGGKEIPPKNSTSTNAGYIQPVPFINAVHRTQTAHNPDPFDPTPALRGISVFYGDMVYGRVSFAMVSDRQFKSGPQNVDTGGGRADHLSDPSIDPATLDKPELALLGNRQEEFLEHWITDWRGADMKVLLSGTTFANAATHHGAPDGRLIADIDSGGWPQTARNRALEIARRGLAFHLSGDQHIATLIKHGIERQRDAIWGFCTPAISVGYQRWWRPDEVGMPHQNRPAHNLPDTGEYIDGLGNKIFVYAVANPTGTRHDHRYQQAQVKASGFGLCRFDTSARTIDVHCYKFLTDVTKPNEAHEYPGWPITLTQRDQDGRTIAGHLPEVSVEGVENAVMMVHNQATGELVYCLRLRGNTVRPWVFDADAAYTVRLGDPDRNAWKEFTELRVQP